MECLPLEGTRGPWLVACARQEIPQPPSATGPRGSVQPGGKAGVQRRGGRKGAGTWSGRIGTDLEVQGISSKGSSQLRRECRGEGGERVPGRGVDASALI